MNKVDLKTSPNKKWLNVFIEVHCGFPATVLSGCKENGTQKK